MPWALNIACLAPMGSNTIALGPYQGMNKHPCLHGGSASRKLSYAVGGKAKFGYGGGYLIEINLIMGGGKNRNRPVKSDLIHPSRTRLVSR